MRAVFCGMDAQGVAASTPPRSRTVSEPTGDRHAPLGRRRRLAPRPRRPRGPLLREPHDDFETTARDVAWGELVLLFVQDDEDEEEDDDGPLAPSPPAFREAQLHLSFVNKAPSSSKGPSRDDDDDDDDGRRRRGRDEEDEEDPHEEEEQGRARLLLL